MFNRRDLAKLLAPLIVEQILTVLVGMIDVAMVAAVGEAAVSGVSLVDSISILIIQILAALATGGAVVASQYLGKKETENACRAAGQLVLVTTLLSVAVSFIALIGNNHLLRLIFGNVEDAVMQDAKTYFWITSLSYPFLAIYNSCAALFRSMGNSKVSMATSIIMNTINLSGNAVCIYILHMGVAGVAFPTLVSRIAAAVMMVIMIQDTRNIVRIHNLKELRFNRHMIKNILSIGIPNGLESGMFQFGKIALQSLVSSLGTAAIASYAVASNLVTILYLPGNAIGLGLITIVGQCVGAGALDEAKRFGRNLTLLNYAILTVLCAAMVIWAGPLVGIYQLSPQAAEISRQLIIAHSIAMLVWPLSFTIPYTLRASSDAKFTMTVSVCSMWIFRIGSAYLFVRVFQYGVIGVWYGMFIDWIIRAVIFSWRFHGFEKRAVVIQ